MTGRTLEELGLADAPRDHPLTYPGAWPAASGLLHGDRRFPLEHLVYDDRAPVLAGGSNACPGQLRHKMAESGLDVGVSAHVSRFGYVSASPVKAPRALSELFVIWLDRRQLEVIDASEGVPLTDGNFWRDWLPAPQVLIELPDAEIVDLVGEQEVAAVAKHVFALLQGLQQL